MDRYSARINLHGTTERERKANHLRNAIKQKAAESLSYKNIKLNGIETQLIIDSGTQPYYKDYKSLPGQKINIGDYVEWANSKWIVYTCDYDDEFYRNGKLYQCNYLLKWQNDVGHIIERWAHIQSASKYNDGTTGNNVITLGSDQLSIIMPIDTETIKLKKSMNKKFFIDYNTQNPTTYELTGTGNVTDTYNGYGVTFWIVKECAYTPTKEDIKFGVCDYRNPNIHIPPKPNETTNLFARIDGNLNIKVGFPRTYTVKFTDYNSIELSNVNFRWDITSNFEIQQTINGNEIKLFVDDNSLIGSRFSLQVLDSQNMVLAKIEPTIVKGY